MSFYPIVLRLRARIRPSESPGPSPRTGVRGASIGGNSGFGEPRATEWRRFCTKFRSDANAGGSKEPEWPRYNVKQDGKYEYPPEFVRALHVLGKKHVVIAGGTGYIARMLRLALLEHGHGVSIITRQSLPMWPFSGEMARQWWEVTSTEKGIPACDALVQLTGTPWLSKEVLTPETKQELYESRSGITGLLAHHIPRMSFPPLLYIQGTSAGIYPPSPDREYDETYDGPPNLDLVGSVTFDYERASTDIKKLGIRTVQVRMGQIIGDDGFVQRVHRADKKGKFFWTTIGTGNQWFPWIHIADVCDLLVHIIENDNIEGAVNAVAPERIKQGDFAHLISKELGFHLKGPMSEAMAHYLYPYRAEHVLEGQDVVPRVALDTGFCFRYPHIEDALADTRPYWIPQRHSL